MAGHEEIEIKLALGNEGAVRALRGTLKKLGAKMEARVFERNVLFDRAAELRSEGRLLRVRVERKAVERAGEGVEAAVGRARKGRIARALVTFKGPTGESGGKYKRREEIEVVCEPGENLEAILVGVGFTAGFTYEKLRTTYRLRKLPGLAIELDETPIGTYLELEGSPKEIDEGAAVLGFRGSDYLTATYWDLHVADARGKRIEPGHMVFKSQ